MTKSMHRVEVSLDLPTRVPDLVGYAKRVVLSSKPVAPSDDVMPASYRRTGGDPRWRAPSVQLEESYELRPGGCLPTSGEGSLVRCKQQAMLPAVFSCGSERHRTKNRRKLAQLQDRRSGRAVEGSGFENRRWRKSSRGSNPFSSARNQRDLHALPDPQPLTHGGPEGTRNAPFGPQSRQDLGKTRA